MNLMKYLEVVNHNTKEIRYWKAVLFNKDIDMLEDNSSLINKLLTEYERLFNKPEGFKQHWIDRYELACNDNSKINMMIGMNRQANGYIKEIIEHYQNL